MPKPATTYRYRWMGEWPVVLTGHQRPDGRTIEVDPGEEFESITQIDHPLVVEVDAKKDTKSESDPAAPEA
jgi:hypothetical protein